MNYTLIILGIILVLVLYVLYRFMTDRQTMVSSKVYLADKPGNKSFGELANPGASRYSYNLWIYVVSLGSDQKIFEIDDGQGKYRFKLEVTTSGDLNYHLNTPSKNYNDGESKYNISSNFPLQKWVCVSVSVDNDVVDTYLDGKLVKSQKMEGNQYTSLKTSQIEFGQGDIYIAEFERLPNPIDPQTAWDRYMAGNGGSYISNAFAAYGANLILTKDQVDMKKYALF
jgi:hypothetical protein